MTSPPWQLVVPPFGEAAGADDEATLQVAAHDSSESPVTGGERSTAQSLSFVTSTPDRSNNVTNSSCRGCPNTTR